MKTYADCQGCALCLLSCPMWMQQRDVGFSPQGVFKALQGGEEVAEIAPALELCMDCGACDVLCPENIEVGASFDDLRVKTGINRQKTSFEEGNQAFSLTFEAKVRQKIQKTDFYVITAAAFHAEHASRVGHYTSLQQETGCSMNLDLQRNAIPTGIGSHLDEAQQIAWLLQGRSFERILVEDKNDVQRLAELSGKPVIHLADI